MDEFRTSAGADLTKKLDGIHDRLTGILVEQAEIKRDLREHMRRTALNEKNGHRLEALIVTVRDGLERKLRPIQKHVDRVQFLFAILVGAGALAGVVKSLLELLRYLAKAKGA